MLCYFVDSFASCFFFQWAEVPDRPGPPTNDNINAKSVMISWTAPLANNAPILRYEVKVDARPFSMVVNRTIATNISRQLLINELLPFVMYEIRVRAVNIVGKGMLSEPLNITTDQDGKQKMKNAGYRMIFYSLSFLDLPALTVVVIQFVKQSSFMNFLACSHLLNHRAMFFPFHSTYLCHNAVH